MIDNGKLSTILVTIIGAILFVFISDPTIMTTLLGSENIKIAAAITSILIVIYNAYFPRKVEQVEAVMPPVEGA